MLSHFQCQFVLARHWSPFNYYERQLSITTSWTSSRRWWGLLHWWEHLHFLDGMMLSAQMIHRLCYLYTLHRRALWALHQVLLNNIGIYASPGCSSFNWWAPVWYSICFCFLFPFQSLVSCKWQDVLEFLCALVSQIVWTQTIINWFCWFSKTSLLNLTKSLVLHRHISLVSWNVLLTRYNNSQCDGMV